MKRCNRALAGLVLAILGCLVAAQTGGCPPTGGGTTQGALNLAIVGNGSVTLAPPGSTYATKDTPVTVTYDSGTTVTLTATPETGWVFVSWEGDLTGSDNPATLLMDGDKTVTAVFGSGGGSVQGNCEQGGTWTGTIVARDHSTGGAQCEGDCSDTDTINTVSVTRTWDTTATVTIKIGDTLSGAPLEADGATAGSSATTYHQFVQERCTKCSNPTRDVCPGNSVTTDHQRTENTACPITAADVELGYLPLGDPSADTFPVRISILIKPSGSATASENTAMVYQYACDGTSQPVNVPSTADTDCPAFGFDLEGTYQRMPDCRDIIHASFSAPNSKQGGQACVSCQWVGTEECELTLVREP